MRSFEAVFHSSPTVIASAPGRVNLLGEHTDYNEGFVLPTAIPQQTTVALRFNGTDAFAVHAEALHSHARFTRQAAPEQHFASYVYGCIRGIEDRGTTVPGLDIHVSSQVPMGVGLSSSAALEVAMLRALRTLLGLELDDVAVAKIAQRAEIEYAGVQCGIMDQMAASLADTSSMLFLDTRSLERALLPLPTGELLVVDSGVSRSLADTGYNQRRVECAQAAALLGVASLRDVDDPAKTTALPEPLRARARHVISENARVLHAAGGTDAEAFGALMNASHHSLRDDYQVSVPALDTLAALLQANPGVHGAKLTGAGFGGACVALCRPGLARKVGAEVIAQYRHSGHSGRVLVPVTDSPVDGSLRP